MMNSADIVLEGEDLAKDFVQGGVTLQVLKGASIRVRAGERIAIVGASGSGKTTLLQLLGGLDLPTRGTVGISATGMTACPCAQELVAARARERLSAQEFSLEQIDRILESVPVATHNQRGLATLHIGCTEECAVEIDATTLLEIAEASMSSEIYELMKRADEVEVVEKAHRRPRFVEDCVREMIGGVVRTFAELGGESFVSARQENLETIHQHNVVAERHGLLSELRAEIESGTPSEHQTSLEEWLAAGARA